MNQTNYIAGAKALVRADTGACMQTLRVMAGINKIEDATCVDSTDAGPFSPKFESRRTGAQH